MGVLHDDAGEITGQAERLRRQGGGPTREGLCRIVGSPRGCSRDSGFPLGRISENSRRGAGGDEIRCVRTW
jgi:hypothetical protein